MDRTLSEYLTNYLPQCWDIPQDERTPALVRRDTSHKHFYIVDDINVLLSTNYLPGSASFEDRREYGRVEVIHFEHLVKSLTPSNNHPPCCDCLVAHKDVPSTIFFVELAQYTPENLDKKRLRATQIQLPQSIEYCYRVTPFLDHYKRKIALFAYTLNGVPDSVPSNHPMRNLKRVTQRTGAIAGCKRICTIAHGFELFECRAPAKFVL